MKRRLSRGPALVPALVPAALAGFLALSSEPAAGASACPPPTEAPEVALKELRGKITYSNGNSSSQLRRKFDKAGGRRFGADWQHVGLTGRNLVTELRIGVHGRPGRDGVCAALGKVEMTVGYDRIKVYIDRRYRPGSCEYQAILDHENEHVSNFRSILASHLPELRDRLYQEATALGALRVRDLKHGAVRFQDIITARMEPYLQSMIREMNAADARIDTPESYRANQARCSNW